MLIILLHRCYFSYRLYVHKQGMMMLCRFSDFINDVTFICVPQFRLLAPPCIVLLRCILVDGTCNPNSFVSSSA